MCLVKNDCSYITLSGNFNCFQTLFQSQKLISNRLSIGSKKMLLIGIHEMSKT